MNTSSVPKLAFSSDRSKTEIDAEAAAKKNEKELQWGIGLAALGILLIALALGLVFDFKMAGIFVLVCAGIVSAVTGFIWILDPTGKRLP